MNELFSKLKDIAEIKGQVNDNLSNMSIEGDAGGGLVRLTVNGLKEIDNITIDDSLMGVENKKMLCDLIITASHVANAKVDDTAEDLNLEASIDILPDLLK